MYIVVEREARLTIFRLCHIAYQYSTYSCLCGQQAASISYFWRQTENAIGGDEYSTNDRCTLHYSFPNTDRWRCSGKTLTHAGVCWFTNGSKTKQDMDARISCRSPKVKKYTSVFDNTQRFFRINSIPLKCVLERFGIKTTDTNQLKFSVN